MGGQAGIGQEGSGDQEIGLVSVLIEGSESVLEQTFSCHLDVAVEL